MAHLGGKKNACRLLDEALKGKRSLGRHRHRLRIVKIYLKNRIGMCRGMHLAQDRARSSLL
jgi:hypothetical protein